MQHREKGQDQKTQEKDISPVLLSKTELHTLLGETKVSKLFDYQIRSRIKKKVKTLMVLELPLLVKSNFIDNSLGRDLETGTTSTTQALVRQRSWFSLAIRLRWDSHLLWLRWRNILNLVKTTKS
jgi:hypothetical protein